jgi:hypothetical protein
MRFTPSNINNLEPNEVFVFGSNEAGIHGAGAALLARIKFGAVIGEGFGLYGQSFAIPTKDEKIKTLPIHSISQYVQAFLIFASKRQDLTFYVTEIGCGLAGWTPKDIAPMFKDVSENMILPESFWKIINQDCM